MVDLMGLTPTDEQIRIAETGLRVATSRAAPAAFLPTERMSRWESILRAAKAGNFFELSWNHIDSEFGELHQERLI